MLRIAEYPIEFFIGSGHISVGERDDSRFHLDEGFQLLSNIENPEGTRSNLDGIGVRVRVGDQHDHATTSVGYASSSAGGLHFGLGTLETVGEIEILWPSATVQVLPNVRTNQILTVK